MSTGSLITRQTYDRAPRPTKLATAHISNGDNELSGRNFVSQNFHFGVVNGAFVFDNKTSYRTIAHPYAPTYPCPKITMTCTSTHTLQYTIDITLECAYRPTPAS